MESGESAMEARLMLNAAKIGNNADKVWEETKLHLKKHLGQATFNSWIKPLGFVSLENGFFKMSH